MINQEKDCHLLTKLGMTSLQAKAYLTLVHIGTATAKAISAQAQMDRADVYRVIESLQQQSLVEKIISTPIEFRAVPVQDGINILLERKHKENAKIEKEALLFLKQYRYEGTETEQLEDRVTFSLVPPRETHTRSFLNLLSNAQSFDAIVPAEHFKKVAAETEEHLRNFLEKGGKHQVIIYGSKNQNELNKIIKNFRNLNKGSCETRYTPRNLVAAFAIFDKQKLWIDTLPEVRTDEQPNLFTNSPVIVELAKVYFEGEWGAAVSIKAGGN